jgi:hypothetical protein
LVGKQYHKKIVKKYPKQKSSHVEQDIDTQTRYIIGLKENLNKEAKKIAG